MSATRKPAPSELVAHETEKLSCGHPAACLVGVNDASAVGRKECAWCFEIAKRDIREGKRLERMARLVVENAHATFQDEYCKHEHSMIGTIRALEAMQTIADSPEKLQQLREAVTK